MSLKLGDQSKNLTDLIGCFKSKFENWPMARLHWWTGLPHFCLITTDNAVWTDLDEYLNLISIVYDSISLKDLYITRDPKLRISYTYNGNQLNARIKLNGEMSLNAHINFKIDIKQMTENNAKNKQ